MCLMLIFYLVAVLSLQIVPSDGDVYDFPIRLVCLSIIVAFVLLFILDVVTQAVWSDKYWEKTHNNESEILMTNLMFKWNCKFKYLWAVVYCIAIVTVFVLIIQNSMNKEDCIRILAVSALPLSINDFFLYKNIKRNCDNIGYNIVFLYVLLIELEWLCIMIRIAMKIWYVLCLIALPMLLIMAVADSDRDK